VRVLVTGATGLIGSRLVPALAEEGCEVVAVVRDPAGLEQRAGVTLLVRDLTQPFDDDVGHLDTVVHLAHHPHVEVPENARLLYRLNAMSTQELLETARRSGATRFVYASTGGVYGFGEAPFVEEQPPRARDLYALSKLHAEELVEAYRPYLDGVVVRPFFPYGARQQGRLISLLGESIREGRPVRVREDGGPRCNPVYVDDVAQVFVALATRPEPPALLNAAGDEVVDIRELAHRIGSAVGREPRFIDAADRSTGHVVGANERMRALLARPLISLETGLARTFSAVHRR
jgi:UDP-glucose 4-epimerase